MAASSSRSKPRCLVSQLDQAGRDRVGLKRTVRDLKNEIIGRPWKKRRFLGDGAVPRLTELLTECRVNDGTEEEKIAVEAAVALGSFACCCEDGAKAVVDSGALTVLERLACSRTSKVVVAAVRSLRLVYVSKFADVNLRLSSLKSLQQLIVNLDESFVERAFEGFTPLGLASLICDMEIAVQEQALCLLNSFVFGSARIAKQIFACDSIVRSVTQQMRISTSIVVCFQGIFFLSCMASMDCYKDTVVKYLATHESDQNTPNFIVRFLQSESLELKRATLWCIISLIKPSFLELAKPAQRASELSKVGVVSQLQSMANESHLGLEMGATLALAFFGEPFSLT